MKFRYILAPGAALDLVEIWRYIKRKAGIEIADKVESVIREKLVFPAANPGGGHWREDLTNEPVKFFPVYSYLIVYQPGAKPLPVVAILHGNRNVVRLLRNRLSKAN